LKTIDTLVEDIGSVLVNKVESLSPELTKKFADSLSQLITNRLTKQSEDRPVGLRMSNIGSPCGRKLWYEVNQKEDAEPLRADTLLKFMFGDVVEELVLFLAEVAGHTVEGRQDTQVIAGIEGHRDAVIDGVTVDVKSANTYGFNKFKNHGLEGDDPFGYQDQLQSYVHAGQKDPVVTDKSRGAFFVVDKQLGHMCLDVHPYKNLPWEHIYEFKKSLVSLPEPPKRDYLPEPDGKGGNTKLGTFCSYCVHKKSCYPNLRTFLYSSGPRFLVNVENEPMVPEVNG